MAPIDAFDVVKAVFGTLIVPQSVIDELRILEEKHERTGRSSMMVAWRHGEYIRQEHYKVAARHNFIFEQIAKIEAACDGTRPANRGRLASHRNVRHPHT